MRRVLPSFCAPIALVLSTSCGGADPVPVIDAAVEDAHVLPPHARISWRVRCDEMPGCMTPPARVIDHDDGQEGVSISCNLTSNPDNVTRRFEMSIAHGTDYSLEIVGATIGIDGDRIRGTGCILRANESGDIPLEGECGPNAPSAGVPCQIQRIDIVDSPERRAFLAQLRCTHLLGRGLPGVVRELTSDVAATSFAEVELTHCDGL